MILLAFDKHVLNNAQNVPSLNANVDRAYFAYYPALQICPNLTSIFSKM